LVWRFWSNKKLCTISFNKSCVEFYWRISDGNRNALFPYTHFFSLDLTTTLHAVLTHVHVLTHKMFLLSWCLTPRINESMQQFSDLNAQHQVNYFMFNNDFTVINVMIQQLVAPGTAFFPASYEEKGKWKCDWWW